MPDGSKNKFYSNQNFAHSHKDSWSLSVRQYYEDKCMRCGWDKCSCDVHHIIAAKNGGENTLDNAIVLCPNCHRIAHVELIAKDLYRIRNKSLIQRRENGLVN